jgi:hypothetical protein
MYRRVWGAKDGDTKSKKAAGKEPITSYTVENFRKAVAELIISSDLEFSFVDSQHFWHVCKMLKFNCDVFKSDTLKRTIDKHFANGCQIIKSILQAQEGKFGITTDIWTSEFKMDFIGYTLHFIDSQWNLISFTLDFKNIKTTHSGDTMFVNTKEVLEYWNLSNKIASITMDNASSNDKFAKLLESCDSVDFTFDMRVSCFAHVLNLACQDALKMLKEPLSKIRILFEAVTKNSSRLNVFENCCNELNTKYLVPPKDVKTRWNSTFDMLCFSLTYKTVFDKVGAIMVKDKDSGVTSLVTSNEWNQIKTMAELLRPFKVATDNANGSQYPTSSIIVPMYYLMLNGTSKWIIENKTKLNKDEFGVMICNAAENAYDKLKKYYDKLSPLLNVATVLDPRCNISFFSDLFQDQGEVKLIEKQVRAIYERDYKKYQKENNNPTVVNSLDFSSLLSNDSMLEAAFNPNKRARIEIEESNQDELERYFGVQKAEYSIDPLKWWSSMESSYPSVARMAKDFLCIVATSTPCERVFSSAKYSIPAHRSSLNPETIRTLQCYKSWIKDKNIMGL